MGALEGRAAVVTGLSRSGGIGAAFARRLAADGAGLFLTTWHQPPLAPGRPAEALRYPLRALSPWLAAAALLAAALVALTGCASNQASSAPRPSAAPSPPVVKDGHRTLSPLSLRCGILGVTGTHSEAPPEGEFCALRLRVANPDPAFHTFVAARQRLAGVAQPRDAPSGFAMAVRRQHDQVELGGQNVLEVELWYDVPKGAPVSGVRLSGDSDPEGFQSDQTVADAPDGVLVARNPAR